jgi:hypothetical protein
MDKISVISLSSSSTKETPRGVGSCSIVTISSETQRVPVSWESNDLTKKNGTILELESTPNLSQKVKDWMNTCKYDDENCDSVDDNNKNNQTTCIRYDFEKSTRTTTLPKSCFTRATPLFSYMEEAKKNTCLNDSRKNNAECHRHNGKNAQKNADYDTPLSPESQKKELCSYLQLMKPDDKPENFFVEYRRSVRVKNLAQNSEKKELEDKSRNKESQNVVSDCSKCDKASGDVQFPALKSFKELKMKMNRIGSLFKQKTSDCEVPNKYLPLPPQEVYMEETDFEDSLRDFMKGSLKATKNGASASLRKVENRKKFKFSLKRTFKKSKFNFTRINTLRSKGRLREISLDTLILRKSHLRKKARRKLFRQMKEKTRKDKPKKPEKIASPRCEIISVHTTSDDENVDLKNFVDDMLELDKMSEEHRKSVIESRILASSSITNLINKQATPEADVQKAYKIFSDLSGEKKTSDEKENNTHAVKNLVTGFAIADHDYTDASEKLSHEEDDDDDDDQSTTSSVSPVPIPDLQVLPVNTEVEAKSLHRSLALGNRRKSYLNNCGLHNWSSGSGSDNKKLNHSISISKADGAVLRAFYQDYNLVIAQQNSVSFWTQSALGNVLGAQNMWIPKGQTPRIPLNSTYIQKGAMEMVISIETSVAYVELWTKEHKSEIREVPVADVFATVYFWRLRQNGLDKKVLQLENIKGFADDVQYCVLRCYPRIIVSWHSVQGGDKRTKIRSYHLAADFQTVANISEIQPVEHYVSSLHNIEDCDNLVMGCGENKITLWNIEYGYIVATVELSNIKSPLSTLWVKCDRGFLFTIQECVDQELRLIAINGMNHSWKKLQNYNPVPGFDRLKGVYIENGILIAYYSQGILCWNAQTGQLIVEEVPNECEYIPCGKHVIMIVNESIVVKHSLSHLITADDL